MLHLDRDRACYWALMAFIGLNFLLGGSGRDDLSSLVILRPLAMLTLSFAAVMLPRESRQANRDLLILAFSGPTLALVQLLPLPPGIWQALPGRELIRQIDAATGLGNIWRPVSLVPSRTINSLLSFASPLAALMLALSLDRRKLEQLVFLFLAFGAISAVIGLLQSIGGAGTPLYFYRITNAGSAVGLFANRNHHAIFLACLLPMIAACPAFVKITAEQVKLSQVIAGGLALSLLPFILATQSRAGLVLAPVGLALGWWTYQRDTSHLLSRRGSGGLDPRLIFGAAVAIVVVVFTLVIARTSVLQRLAQGDPNDEMRFQVWMPITRLATEYLPFGTGLGTFVEVWRISEPDSQLSPVYLNHAHNDLLEAILTGGLPALAILVFGIVLMAKRFSGLTEAGHANRALRRLGASVLLILVLGSLYDYPLRIPSLAVLMAIALVWFAGASRPAGRPNQNLT